MGDELVQTLTTTGRSPSVKVIILKGAGRSFSAGDDRTEGATGKIPDFPWENPYHSPHVEPLGVMRHGYFQLMGLIRRLPQMVIAQVHGYCIGSAVDITLAADFAIADPEARIQLVFGARGIGPAGTVFLPKYVGLKKTMQLLFDPGFLSAHEAAELGLITSVAEAGRLDDEVDALAERLRGLGETYYGYFGMVKEAVNRTAFPTLDEDVRTQILATRLSDMYRLSHPAQPPADA
jgi:2-(1,2-epoxy-1,2-dihydrophenyl)acetyl-CoA isomerase